MMPSVQRIVRPFYVLGSNQQFGPADGWIHAAGIVGPDHGLNPNLIQNAFRDLSVYR
jgi:hypothetical protein